MEILDLTEPESVTEAEVAAAVDDVEDNNTEDDVPIESLDTDTCDGDLTPRANHEELPVAGGGKTMAGKSVRKHRSNGCQDVF